MNRLESVFGAKTNAELACKHSKNGSKSQMYHFLEISFRALDKAGHEDLSNEVKHLMHDIGANKGKKAEEWKEQINGIVNKLEQLCCAVPA